MKRYLSILMPAARLTLWKALGIVLLTAGAEAALFFAAMRSWSVEDPPILEALIQRSHISLVFAGGLLLLCGALVLPGLERGAKTGYTLRRLSVRESTLTLLWGAQNALLLLFYWASQLTILLALSQWFFHTAEPGTVSHQSLFLACYRSPYLHGLLPLEDWLVALRNVTGCAALGLSASAFAFHRRHGRHPFLLLPLAVTAAFGFPVEPASFTLTIAATTVFILMCVYLIRTVPGVRDDED